MIAISIDEFLQFIQGSTEPIIDGFLMPIIDGQALEVVSSRNVTGPGCGAEFGQFRLWSKEDVDDYKKELLEAANGIGTKP